MATFTTAKITDEEPHDYQLSNTSATLPAGTHQVRIIKATEADWNGGSPVPNYVTFHGMTATSKGGTEQSDGKALVTVMAPPALPTRKIEFLGDSITAGYCNQCEDTSGKQAGGHGEAYGRSWDYQICETLDAQCHTAAWSGLGMVRNCCGGNTTMPAIFNRSLATDSTTVCPSFWFSSCSEVYVCTPASTAA